MKRPSDCRLVDSVEESLIRSRRHLVLCIGATFSCYTQERLRLLNESIDGCKTVGRIISPQFRRR